VSAARRTPSLGEAILWIIEEDAPGDNLSLDDLAASLTVCLVADLFGKQCREIAAAVHGARNGSLWVGDFRVLMAALMKRGDSNEGARAYLQKLGGKS